VCDEDLANEALPMSAFFAEREGSKRIQTV